MPRPWRDSELRVPERRIRRRFGAIQLLVASLAGVGALAETLVTNLPGPASCDGTMVPSATATFRASLLPWIAVFLVMDALLIVLLLFSRRHPEGAWWLSYMLSFPLGILSLAFLLSGPSSAYVCFQLSQTSQTLLGWASLVLLVAALSTIWTTFYGLPVREDLGAEDFGILWK